MSSSRTESGVSTVKVGPPVKHKISAVVAVLLLAAAAAVIIWVVFARADLDVVDQARSGEDATSSPRPTPSASPSFAVPAKRVDPMSGASYCTTAKLLGIYAHQSYGLDPDLGVVTGRHFAKRLDVVAATYRRLATQASKRPEVGAPAAKSWRVLAAAVEAAGQKLKVTGYDVQSQVMILELAEVAKVTQAQLPRATATLSAACGVTRDELGL